MQPQTTVRAHFKRVTKMAEANGVDLSIALDKGKISVDAYAGMVTRCQGCTQLGACDRLLARVGRLPTPPAYCENRDHFAMLKSG